MEEVKQLTTFFDAIKEDNRIGASHICLYMALFQLYNLNRFQNPIKITRLTLMGIAKIGGLATYHRCIKDLADFGYISYTPSYNPAVGSLVYLLKVE